MSASPEIARQNGMKGGRPKGRKNQATLDKEKVLAAMRQRIMQKADILISAQSSLAQGQQFLYKIEKELIIGPKGGKKYVSSKPKLVTNQGEIEMYLDGLVESGDKDDENDPNATYYFITTKEPNNFAIDSMFDRTFGKSTQRTEIMGKDGEPLVLNISGEVVKKYTNGQSVGTDVTPV